MVDRVRSGRPRIARQAAYLVQTVACLVLFGLLRPLPLDMAAAIGGWLLRTVGPHTALSRRAAANLRRVFPDIDDVRLARIVAGMWDNIGRVGVEYAHLAKLRRQPHRVQVTGGHILDDLRRAGRPVLLFGGHLANWEAILMAAQRHGLDPCMAYRPFNNPGIEWLARWMQRANGAEYVGVRVRSSGMRRIAQILEGGGQTVLLVDQRMNRGRPIPFFGRPAMTSTALARLARRFDAAAVPMRVERLDGTAFRVTVEPPLSVPPGDDRRADEEALMAAANRRLEAWIRARPEQWMWLHRRWPKEATPESGT